MQIAGTLLGLIFSCSSPQPEADGKTESTFWQPADPESLGINPAVVDSIHEEISQGKYGLIDRFLLIIGGKVVADHQYQQDYSKVMLQHDTTNHQYNYDHVEWHPYYDGTDLHTLQSVTKSVTSVLLGIAVDQGLIRSINSPAMSYFTAYQPDISDDRKNDLSIYDLLTMQSGIQWDEENYDEAHNSCVLMEGSRDWIQFVLNHPMDTIPGTVFEYNSGASVLLGKIVREATGQRIDSWAEEKLFAPLGIENHYWKITPKGEIDTEGGLYLNAYDLAKIGCLMLQGGMWEGQRIVSNEWVKNSLSPHVSFGEDSGYGFQWWIPDHHQGQAAIFAGNGYGGQFLQVVPELDLIVVFNGWNIHDTPEKSSWTVLEERILPAVLSSNNNEPQKD